MKITAFYIALILACARPVLAQSDHAVSNAAGEQINPAITADGQGNAIMVWHDFRNESDTADDLYAQKIDRNGNVAWQTDGVPVCTEPSTQIGIVLGEGETLVVTSPAQIADDGNGGAVEPQSIPTDFMLEQNFPNPFNPSTTIHYSLPEETDVEVTIFDVNGRSIRTLVKTKQQAGTHTTQFDARDLASGVYFYRLRAGRFVRTRKMRLLR